MYYIFFYIIYLYILSLRNSICLSFVVNFVKANTRNEPPSMFDANILNYQAIYMPSTNMQVSRPSNFVNPLSTIHQQSIPLSHNTFGNYYRKATFLAIIYIILDNIFFVCIFIFCCSSAFTPFRNNLLTRQPNNNIVPETGNIVTPKMAHGRSHKNPLDIPILPKKTRQRRNIQNCPPIISTQVGTSSSVYNILSNSSTQRTPLSDIA